MPQSPSPSAATAAVSPYDPLEVLAVALTAPHPEELTPAEIAERVRDLYSAAERRRHDACRDLVARLAPLAAAGPDDLIDAARLCQTEPDGPGGRYLRPPCFRLRSEGRGGRRRDAPLSGRGVRAGVGP
ncbi:MAG TPA: hypothetical protein VIW01_10450 [Dehalococcoidia bacterium]